MEIKGVDVEKLIDKMSEVLTEVKKIDTSLQVFKSDVDTKLTDVSGRMKGNFELLQKDVGALNRTNELQHEAMLARFSEVDHRVSVLEDEVKNFSNRDREIEKELDIKDQAIRIDLQDGFNSIRADQNTNNDRMVKIESKLNVIWAIIGVAGLAALGSYSYLLKYVIENIPG